jgi:anti-anti-sigma regulatory factor
MLKIERSLNGRVLFSLAGRIESEHVPELQRLLSLEKGHRRIAFDLTDVTLIDREVMKFLARCEADSIGLENCPLYLRQWIERENKRG